MHAFVASSAKALLQGLASDVVGVGPGCSLAAKVSQALAYHAAGNLAVACAILGEFVREVSAQRGKKIAPAVADKSIADAGAIVRAIGCR